MALSRRAGWPVSGGVDAGEGPLGPADRVFGFRVLLEGRLDGAEGGAVSCGQGPPGQDRRQRGGTGAEEPGWRVDTGQVDGQNGERFPQVFQSVGVGQGLLELRGTDGGAEIGGGLRGDGTVGG